MSKQRTEGGVRKKEQEETERKRVSKEIKEGLRSRMGRRQKASE